MDEFSTQNYELGEINTKLSYNCLRIYILRGEFLYIVLHL